MPFDIFSGCVKKTVTALVCLCAAACAFSSGVFAYDAPYPAELPARNLVGDTSTVSRAMAAKMLALISYSQTEINALPRVIAFSDTSAGSWYDRYINAVFTAGYMTGYGNRFRPERAVTLEEAGAILGKLDKNKNLTVKLTDDNRGDPISFALWNELYINLLADLSGKKPADPFSSFGPDYGMAVVSYVVLATPRNNDKLSGFNAITDRGPVTFYGLNLDAYIDKAVRVIAKDGDIVSALSVESGTPTLKNAYIARINPGAVTVFIGGAERTYRYSGALADARGKICDITIDGGRASDITVLGDTFTDTVKASDSNGVEFAGRGVIRRGGDFRVYSIADGPVKWKSLSAIIPGADGILFTMRGGELAAAVILKNTPPDTIRVALNTTGFAGLYHKTVSLTGTSAFTVKGAAEKSYKAGQTVDITGAMFGGSRIYVTPARGGKLVLKSVTRGDSKSNPAYSGTLEIAKAPGGYVVVNELGMEQYLYAVLPSEMPTKYGAEAMKAQAVCARSYAFNQIYENRFAAYGANVDDSVSSQVYNNVPENGVSVRAADATAGECLTYDGNVVSANYFSTSCGMTADSGDVWADAVTGRFPSQTVPYQTAQMQYDPKKAGVDFGDLSVEANFDKFISSGNIGGYDSGFPWFRWSVTMTAKEVAASIDAEIQNRYKIHPDQILTLQPDGTYKSRPVSTVGALKDLSVIKRGAGGNIMELKATGAKATVLIMTEYNVRDLLAPRQRLAGGKPIATVLKDGTAVKDSALMPSAFFMITRVTDKRGAVAQYKFTGGGFGHGVGMSQNGASAMAGQGFTYTQILSHYYRGADIVKKY